MSENPDAFARLDLPPSSRRLFAHYPTHRLVLEDAAEFVIGRLLEEGDTADLRWLAGSVGEAHLARWLRRRGGRHLSRRSRAFWEVVLRCQVSEPGPGGSELWAL